MKKPIPVATEKPNKKRARRDAVRQMYSDLTKEVKRGLGSSTEEELESLIAAAMSLMSPPEGVEDITLPAESLRQIGLFAAQAVSRQLWERYVK